MSGEQLSASIDETNAMRAKLGLKPLGNTNASVAKASTVNDEKTIEKNSLVEDAAAKRLAHARQQRMLGGAVHLNHSLSAKSRRGGAGAADDDEDDSPAAFIARQRLATQRLEKEHSVRAQQAKQKQKQDQYSSADLAGVTIGHSADQFTAGETRILTLADSEVLHGEALNEDEDLLVDVEIAASERLQFLQDESKRKRYDVYEAADAGASASGSRSLLDFYDERQAGSGSIRLDATGGLDMSRLEREAMIERQLEARRSGRVLYELSSLKDPVIASDTRAPEEIIASTFKKPRTKKKRTKERSAATVSTADLIAEINSTSGGGVAADSRGDRGSRAARDHVGDDDNADAAEAAAIARAKRDAYDAARGKAKRAASARLGGPDSDDEGAGTTAGDSAAAIGAAADDDDDNGDEQLYAALDRARRTAATAPTDVAATILARQAKREADAARHKGIVYTDTTQFISTLDAQIADANDDEPAVVVKAEQPIKKETDEQDNNGGDEEPQPDMDMDVDDKVPQATDDNNDAEESEEGGAAAMMGSAGPTMSIGIGAALSMLRAQGEKALPEDIIVGRRTDERMKRRADDMSKPLDNGAPTVERARQLQTQQRSSARAESASERRQYNFELKYTDDEGRELTTKEAYRHLSYKFHGIAPSANKREKYAKQREEELAARQMAENVEESALKLERLQKKKRTAGIEFKHL